MPRGRPNKPKVFLSDEAVRPEDVLPKYPTRPGLASLDGADAGNPPVGGSPTMGDPNVRSPEPGGTLAGDPTPGRDPAEPDPDAPVPYPDEPARRSPAKDAPEPKPGEPRPADIPDSGDDGDGGSPEENEAGADSDDDELDSPDEDGQVSPDRSATAPPGYPQSDQPVGRAVPGRPTGPLTAPSQSPPPNRSVTPAPVTYRSRISVVEAWQYPGSLSAAPPWVDRAWASWADADQLTGALAGPGLRVPIPSSLSQSNRIPVTPGTEPEKMARVGDYLVKQRIALLDDLDGDEVIDVWPKEEFEKLFMPTTTLKKTKLKAA